MTTSSGRAGWGITAGIVGPIVFGTAAVVGGLVEGGYSSERQFVSELAARGSDVRLPMTIGFLVFGVCILLFAASLRSRWPAVTAGVVAVALSGAGTFLAGTFSCDAGCPTEGARSLSQQLHDVTSVATFLSWLAAALLIGWAHRRAAYGKASLALAAVEIACLGALASFMPREVDDPVGVYQRVLLLAVGAWFVVTALAARSSGRSAGATG